MLIYEGLLYAAGAILLSSRAQHHHRTAGRQTDGKRVLVLQLQFHAEGDIYNGAGVPGGRRSASGAALQRDLAQEHNRKVKSRSVMLRLISFGVSITFWKFFTDRA